MVGKIFWRAEKTEQRGRAGNMKKALLLGMLVLGMLVGCSGMWTRARERAGILDSDCTNGVCHTLSNAYAVTTSCYPLYCNAYLSGRVDIENRTEEGKELHLKCTLVMFGGYTGIYDNNLYLEGGGKMRVELGRFVQIANTYHPGHLHCSLREVDGEE